MLRLDPYSESILFQCDRCRRVGELFMEGVMEEGCYYCWNCLKENQKPVWMENPAATKERRSKQYANR